MTNEYKQLKGRIEVYIVENPSKKIVNSNTIEKYIRTELENGTVTISEINNMLSEVERDTVNAFKTHRAYDSRRKRFDDLKKSLIAR